MKKSASQKILIFSFFIVVQALCIRCDLDVDEDETYMTTKVHENKDRLARNMIQGLDLQKHSERLEMKPLEVADIVKDDDGPGRPRARRNGEVLPETEAGYNDPIADEEQSGNPNIEIDGMAVESKDPYNNRENSRSGRKYKNKYSRA